VRRLGGRAVTVVVARHLARALLDGATLAPAPAWWGDTRIEGFAGGKLRAVFADRVLDARDLRLSDVLSVLPAEILVSL